MLPKSEGSPCSRTLQISWSSTDLSWRKMQGASRGNRSSSLTILLSDNYIGKSQWAKLALVITWGHLWSKVWTSLTQCSPAVFWLVQTVQGAWLIWLGDFTITICQSVGLGD
jgi:hypothetical protein